MNKRSMLLAGSSILTIAAITSFLPVGDALAACSATGANVTTGSIVTCETGTAEIATIGDSRARADGVIVHVERQAIVGANGGNIPSAIILGTGTQTTIDGTVFGGQSDRASIDVVDFAGITVSDKVFSSGSKAIVAGDYLSLVINEGAEIRTMSDPAVNGAAITAGNNASIVVGGIIRAGSGSAIDFQGTNSQLTLLSNYMIDGNITSTSGYKLAFGGINYQAFDLSKIGADTQFGNVTSLGKEGEGTWTLTGDATLTGDTTVEDGVLEVTDGTISHGNADVIVGTTNGKSGKLVISEGGKVSANAGFIGNVVGSSGELVVTGVGSVWEYNGTRNPNNDSHGQLVVGNYGTGKLTIENGGKVVSGPFSAVGWGAGSTGTATVTGAGSEWAFDEWFDIGKAGKGTLTVADGGRFVGDDLILGDTTRGDGTLNVTGKNSTVDVEDIFVGHYGKGAILVSDGGKLTGDDIAIGRRAGSNGTVTVTGKDSKIIGSRVLAGVTGKGELTVSAGGALESDRLDVGLNTGSNGTVTVTGKGSTLTAANEISVGGAGQGQLTVSDGAVIKSTAGEIGSGGDGAVILSGAGSRWVITGQPRDLSPTLQVGLFSKGELTISNGAEVAADAVSLGTVGFTGAKGTINIGAAAGKQAVAAGKLTTREIVFGSGDGTLNFNHTDTAYEFSANLSSIEINNEVFARTADVEDRKHEVHQIAGTTLLTGNSALFTGTTYVDGGKLLVGNSAGTGTLGGNISVGAGGVLGGSGTIGTTDAHSVVTVASKGIFAPGNSIGALTINGDLNLLSGSVFEVEIAGDGRGDRVVVTGNAALAGAVKVTALDGRLSYQDGYIYRFLDAATTTGGFSSVSSDSAFLDMTVSADGVGALIKAGFKTPGEPLFATVAKTENQFAASTVLDDLNQHGKSLALYNSILILSAEKARNAFDQLSGEIHASAKSALIENAQLTQNAINNRLRSAFGDAPQSAGVAALGYGPETSAKKPSVFDAVAAKDKAQAGYGAWTQGFGRWSKQDGNGNVGDFKSSTGGFIAGADSVIAENWRLGVLAGYSHTSFNTNERASSGDSENYTLGTYAGSQWALSGGTLSFSTGLAYTWHQLETKRTVAFDNFSDSLNADYKAATVQAFGELGYKVTAGRAAFEPYANLAYTHLKTNSFSEIGTTAASLSVNSDTMDTTFTTLGLRASTAFSLGGVSSTARADIGWRHAYGDVTPHSSGQFIGSSVFTVAGAALAKDVATFEAGLDFDLTQAAKLGVTYNGQFGSGAHQNGFNVKLGVSF